VDSDLDLRKLRYFSVLAEQLNFGRAAAALHIAQPVLTRQIRALEQELRVRLFDRDRGGTRLTAAGRQLQADAGPLLAESAAVRRRLAAAAASTRVFTVGFMPGLTVTGAVRALRAEHPGLDVRVVRTGYDDQAETVRDGTVDVGFVRLPLDTRGLDTAPLHEEPRVVVVGVDHRLAGRAEVRIGDLAAEHLLQHPDVVPEWRDIAVELRDGTRAAGPPARTVEEKLEHVAAGLGIAVLPQSTAAYYTRPDVTHHVLGDIGPSRVLLAWGAGSRDPLVRDFVRIVTSTTAGSPPG
jgi:DNA-binding transcriptional LysR family regulator